ncbi:MAG: ATP synthase F1 subunit delta [Bdellovibrionales bacterium]|nr:ATP synthase F1 subunit delta [Bdellovibrionales bacterium]
MAVRSGKLARRYAKAFLGLVERELGRDGVPTPAQRTAEALAQFCAAWEQHEELSLFLLNPMFELETRVAAVEAIAREYGMNEVLKNFLRLLTERDRLRHVCEISAAFSEAADAAAGVVQVEVLTAAEVDASERAEIESSFAASISGTPIFTWSVDNTLIGGMVIRYGGRIIDGSVRGRLERIERQLSA